MLRNLEIQNYAIIEHLDVDFPSGLAIITGETGAGKSILLGALGLIMGNRADSKVMYNPETKTFVEAVFDIKAYGLTSFFEEFELDYHDELIIRREIAVGGKSRAFVNDSPVTLDILSELTSFLIDIHRQFDMLDIQKPAKQIEVVDALANNKSPLDEYREVFKKYKNQLKNLEDLKAKNRLANQEAEFLKFQIDEFDTAALKTDEQSILESELKKLTAAEEVKKATTALSFVLEEDEQAVIGQLQTLSNTFYSLIHIDPAYNELYERLISSKEELSDMSREATKIADATEYDEAAINTANSRLNQIYKLQKKHNVSNMEALLAVENEIRTKLDGFADLSDSILKKEAEITASYKDLNTKADKLSQNRKKVSKAFEDEIHTMLASLSMENAYIRVQITESSSLNINGKDDLVLLFSPNKGSEFLPLKDIASGGEISRLTLCIKSMVAESITLPTLVFDEIDAGVSGDVALKMGLILDKLALKHQVICITHSPQIASKADVHFWVYKADTTDRTITAMKSLTHDERVTEIAKMLSGNPPTPAAIANAKELIGIAKA